MTDAAARILIHALDELQDVVLAVADDMGRRTISAPTGEAISRMKPGTPTSGTSGDPPNRTTFGIRAG